MTSQRLVIASWNVEHVVPALDRLPELMDAMGKPDVLCLQEVRVRPGDAELVARLEAALPGFECHHALNRDPENGAFRGGRAYGVAMWTRAALAAEPIEAIEWDLEGRAVLVRAAGLLLGDVYAVNGTDRPHYDHALARHEGDRHGWKRAFQSRILGHAMAVARGDPVLLAGDWNVSQAVIDITPRLRTAEPHARARRELSALLAEHDLVDVYRALHSESRGYTWFNRFSRGGRLDAARVDFVLASRSLLPRIEEATILADAVYRKHSDHVPVRVVVTSPRSTRRS